MIVMAKERKKEKEEFGSLFEYYGFTKKDERECPVVSGILKELTPERIKQEIKKIQAVELPVELEKWVEEYEKVGDRDRFLWKWLYHSFQSVFLPGVIQKYKKTLSSAKVLLTIYIALIDDAADKSKNKSLLEKLLKVPEKTHLFSRSVGIREGKLEFSVRVWKRVEEIVGKLPRFEELKEAFQYDVRQVLNATRYAYLVNHNPNLINKIECDFYGAHNMAVMVYSTLDIMCFPSPWLKSLGKIRKVAWHAQKMARIGNWISTWERELQEGDFSNGIVAMAVDFGELDTASLLKSNPLQVMRQVKKMDVEKHLLKQWERCHAKVSENGDQIIEFNEKKFLKQLENFLLLHLLSKGYK